MENNQKQTEFNSSLATLERINHLIILAHNIAIDLPSLKEPERYYPCLDRLYKEGRAKFSEDERARCEEFKKRINESRKKHGSSLYQRFVINANGIQTNVVNEHYNIAWNEVIGYAAEYETYLMELLDKHGMLLTNKATAGDAASQ